MRFDVLTLFPEFFSSPLEQSILKRAKEAKLIEIFLHNFRDWCEDKHRSVDDSPFGGGDGMVMKPDVFERAVVGVKEQAGRAPVILLTPQGRRFNQEWARRLARLERVVLVCGRYAGIDQRSIDLVADEELSIGDYVLSGGELPALVVVEAVCRLIPGALGNEDSAENDSFPSRLEAAQFTRPRFFEGREPPVALVGGDHKKIDEWRKRESLRRTLLRRPDLLVRAPAEGDEKKMLEVIKRELVGN
jgi:tRNA (guanine37-N1)-methyltransferase